MSTFTYCMQILTAYATCSRQCNNLSLRCLRAAPAIHLAPVSGSHSSAFTLRPRAHRHPVMPGCVWTNGTGTSHSTTLCSGTTTRHGVDADGQHSDNTQCKQVIEGQTQRYMWDREHKRDGWRGDGERRYKHINTRWNVLKSYIWNASKCIHNHFIMRCLEIPTSTGRWAEKKLKSS